MKLYVDELPKECFDCPCFEGIETPAFCPCRLDFIENDKVQNYHKFDDCNDNVCPLHSLADYTKQVINEVVQKITQDVKKLIDSKDFKLCNNEYANGYCFGLQYDLAKILDKILED